MSMRRNDLREIYTSCCSPAGLSCFKHDYIQIAFALGEQVMSDAGAGHAAPNDDYICGFW